MQCSFEFTGKRRHFVTPWKTQHRVPDPFDQGQFIQLTLE
jgi:hypothetical protein